MALIGAGLQARVYTALYTSQVSDANIVVSSSILQGRTETVLDFYGGDGVYSRDLETAFSWNIAAGTILYTWQPSIIPKPETTYNRATDWLDGGSPGAKLWQGFVIEADSFNVKKQFQLQDSDTLAFHPLNECPIGAGGGISFNKQSEIAFSCVVPFVAHTVRIVTTDAVPWRHGPDGGWKLNFVTVPMPEVAMGWQTELTSLNGIGWQHLRLLNVEYISATPITLTFTVDSQNGSIVPVTITIPPALTQTKLKIEPSFNKWKLISFNLTSTAPFRLFQEGVSCEIRSWGSSGAYRDEHPFGGQSGPGAAV